MVERAEAAPGLSEPLFGMATVDPMTVQFSIYDEPQSTDMRISRMEMIGGGHALELIKVVVISLPLFLLSYSSCVSYAKLIATGSELETEVVAAMHLFSSGIAGILLPMMSRCPLVVPSADMASTIFFQQIVKDIVSQAIEAGISQEEAAATALLALPLNTILLGLVLYAIGKSKQTFAISYLPYPVVAGFLGTIGLAIFSGGFAVLADEAIHFPKDLPALANQEPHQLASAALMALGSMALTRTRIPPTLTAILPMVFAMGGFWIWVLTTGQDMNDLRGSKWLFPLSDPMPFWRVWTVQDFDAVHFSILAPRFCTFCGLGVVLVLSLVLRIAGIEDLTGCVLDIDAEVKSAGIGCFGTGMFGTVIGSHSPGLTMFNAKSGRTDVSVAISTAVLTLLVWLSGLPVMAMLPRFMLAGILMNLGLTMLVEYLWKARKKVGIGGLSIIYTQVVTSAIAGLLPSVLMGIVAACIVGSASLMNLHVLKYHVSGKTVRSHVQRSVEDEALLRDHADQIEAVGLEGILAEGPMIRFSSYLLRYLEHNQHVRYLVIDFRFIQGCNPSACSFLAKLDKKLRGTTVMYTNTQQEMKERLLVFGVPELRIFSDFSVQEVLKECEDRLLSQLRTKRNVGGSESVILNLNRLEMEVDDDEIDKILLSALAEFLQCSEDQALKLKNVGEWGSFENGAKLSQPYRSSKSTYFALPRYSEVTETMDVGATSGEGQKLFCSIFGAVCGAETALHNEASRSTYSVSVAGSRALSVPNDALKTLLAAEQALGFCITKVFSRQMLFRSDSLAQAMEINKAGGWCGANFDRNTASASVAAEVAGLKDNDGGTQSGWVSTVVRRKRTGVKSKATIDTWANDWIAARSASKTLFSSPIPRMYNSRQNTQESVVNSSSRQSSKVSF